MAEPAFVGRNCLFVGALQATAGVFRTAAAAGGPLGVPSGSEAVTGRAGCLNWARPDLWEARRASAAPTRRFWVRRCDRRVSDRSTHRPFRRWRSRRSALRNQDHVPWQGTVTSSPVQTALLACGYFPRSSRHFFGEISLAHHGVLFLDELPEFHRRSLEVLRQPLEHGAVTISRALNSTTFPASFLLVASMNPCPCGYLGDSRHACKCSPPQIERYMGRISGPLLDRIDLHIEVPAVPPPCPFRSCPPMPTAHRALRCANRSIAPARFNGSASARTATS